MLRFLYAASEVLALSSSAGHHPAHRPQPKPTATEKMATLEGLAALKSLPDQNQPMPTLMRACHASPVNEIDAGKGPSALP